MTSSGKLFQTSKGPVLHGCFHFPFLDLPQIWLISYLVVHPSLSARCVAGTVQSPLFFTTTQRGNPARHYYYAHLIFFLIYFLERGREGERQRKKHQCVDASPVPPTGDLARNPGICPDWESNQQPFGLQDTTQPIKPHQPGPHFKHL